LGRSEEIDEGRVMKYDLTMLRKLSDNDENFILDMLQTFKKTAPPVVVRMEEYIAQNKTEAVGREAHKLIPGVSFLGAKELEAILKIIEENGKTGENKEQMEALILQVKTIVNELISEFETDFNIQ
jgi:HPt (histidine-containing phosphotransfer) domain-containing protein